MSVKLVQCLQGQKIVCPQTLPGKSSFISKWNDLHFRKYFKRNMSEHSPVKLLNNLNLCVAKAEILHKLPSSFLQIHQMQEKIVVNYRLRCLLTVWIICKFYILLNWIVYCWKSVLEHPNQQQQQLILVVSPLISMTGVLFSGIIKFLCHQEERWVGTCCQV